jgi:TRAP-type C4-dicarboxylate transport system substrate-binding protein
VLEPSVYTFKTFKKEDRRMRRWKPIAFAFCLGMINYSLSIAPGLAQTEPVKLNYAMHFVSTHKQYGVGEAWAKEVEKRTNGRVKVAMFPGGTLTPSPQNYDGVVKGISDIGLSWFAYTRGKFPMMEVLDLPLGYKSGLAATRLANEFYRKFKPKELDEVQVMYLGGHGPGILHTVSRPVRKLEDVKGLKIRSTGTSAKIAKALGGTPVALPIGDAYDALKRGVVDSMLVSLEAMEQWKLGEVLRYSIGNYEAAYTTVHFVVMNKEKWTTLPPDVQKIIEAINEEWIGKTGIVWDEVDISARKFIVEKLGNEFIELPEEEQHRWANAVRPLLDEWVESVESKGLPGKEALQFCLERLKMIQ